jgi:hypothetical protein
MIQVSCVLVFLGSIFGVYYFSVANPKESSNLIFFAQFFGITLGLLVSLSMLGRCFNRLFKIRIPKELAFAVGYGVFAIFLSVWIKFSLRFEIPLVLLLGFLAMGIRRIVRQRVLGSKKKYLLVLSILFGLGIGGFVQRFVPVFGHQGLFTHFNDFDSGMIHLAFAKIVTEAGHYFNPWYLRAPFLPQLPHVWYIFINGTFSEFFIKTLNTCFVLGIVYACTGFFRSRTWKIISVLSAFAFLHAGYENFTITTSTNLDAGFTLFMAGVYLSFWNYLKRPGSNAFISLAVLSGLAAGQKHFGLLLSTPLLLFTGIHFFLRNYKETTNQLKFRRFLFSCLMSLVVFFLLFPFYVHNLIEGNSLFFPFFGSLQNTYGWEVEELKAFLGPVIQHWGLRYDLLGFFWLPFDWINHSHEFQYQDSGSLSFYLPSALFIVNFLLLFVLAFKKKKNHVLFTLLFFVEVFFWYKGSQVSRYLFPIHLMGSISILLFFEALLGQYRQKWIYAPLMGILFFSFFPFKSRSHTEIINSPEKKKVWFESRVPAHRLLNILKNEKVTRTFMVTDNSINYFMAGLPFCGDWFGACRYDKLISLGYPNFVSFKDFAFVKPFLKEMKISHIFITWRGLFEGRGRPSTEDEWKSAISTNWKNCLDHLGFDEAGSDLYRLRQSCID